MNSAANLRTRSEPFDVLLSHSHEDAIWVDGLGKRLVEEHRLKVWLDRWVLVPGNSWQQEIEQGFDQAGTCAVCVGARTPDGWFQQEIERALEIQANNKGFRVIPVLLPDASPEIVPKFLSLRTWADFRNGQDSELGFHVLVCGIRGVPVGPWPPLNGFQNVGLQQLEWRLGELAKLKRSFGIRDELIEEYQRRLLDQWLEEG